LSVDPDLVTTGQPYVFTGGDPVNLTDPLGLFLTGGGSSACNHASDGTLYCTGALPSGQSVAGSDNPTTGTTTGAFDVISNASPGQCGSQHGPLPQDNPCDPTIQSFNGQIRSALQLLGQPINDNAVFAADIIVWGENRGSSVCNTNDINYQEGHPSCGLIQVIHSTFEMYRDPALPDNLFNTLANLYAGFNYGISRYKSLSDIPGVISYEGCNGYGNTQGCYRGY
jgi:hypothetical protein